jgi:hypothetical protein
MSEPTLNDRMDKIADFLKDEKVQQAQKGLLKNLELMKEMEKKKVFKKMGGMFQSLMGAATGGALGSLKDIVLGQFQGLTSEGVMKFFDKALEFTQSPFFQKSLELLAKLSDFTFNVLGDLVDAINDMFNGVKLTANQIRELNALMKEQQGIQALALEQYLSMRGELLAYHSADTSHVVTDPLNVYGGATPHPLYDPDERNTDR